MDVLTSVPFNVNTQTNVTRPLTFSFDVLKVCFHLQHTRDIWYYRHFFPFCFTLFQCFRWGTRVSSLSKATSKWSPFTVENVKKNVYHLSKKKKTIGYTSKHKHDFPYLFTVVNIRSGECSSGKTCTQYVFILFFSSVHNFHIQDTCVSCSHNFSVTNRYSSGWRIGRKTERQTIL